MSHFSVLVILDKEQSKDVEGSVEKLLLPFSENMEVEPYDEECWCVGSKARVEANEQAQRELGSWETWRQRFHAQPQEKRSSLDAWKKYTAPLSELEAKLEKAHPLHGKPNAKCEECKGTGTRQSTRNPDSQWDWYEIGGRWTGKLTDYDPEKDPRNIESCQWCGGTGKRNDKLGREARKADPKYTCNGCDGKGKKVKWPTEWAKYAGDIQPMENIKLDFSSFAFLTPGGEWIQRGKMGWWGMVSDETDEKAWKKTCATIMAKFTNGHVGVIVDCHI